MSVRLFTADDWTNGRGEMIYPRPFVFLARVRVSCARPADACGRVCVVVFFRPGSQIEKLFRGYIGAGGAAERQGVPGGSLPRRHHFSALVCESL